MKDLQFPGFTDMSAPLTLDLMRRMTLHRIDAGRALFNPDTPPMRFLVLLSGILRVEGRFLNGPSTLLLSSVDGRRHILSTTGFLAEDVTPTAGIAETDLEVLLLPQDGFDGLMQGSAEFRGLVFKACASRMRSLFDRLSALRADD